MDRVGQKDSGTAQQVEPQSSLGRIKRAYLPSNCANSEATIAVEDHVEGVKGVRTIQAFRLTEQAQRIHEPRIRWRKSLVDVGSPIPTSCEMVCPSGEYRTWAN